MTIQSFAFETRIPRVVFGAGTLARLGSELERLGVESPVLVTTTRGARLFAKLTAEMKIAFAGIFDHAVMHTPVEVTTKALSFAQSVGADGVVSFGGGSAIGLGKMLSLRLRLPHLAIPTTYSGSEMTEVVGETAGGRKRTMRDPAILPATVIYDVDGTLDLPVPTSVTSAMNAIAHAVEAMYAQNGNPLTSIIAEEAIQALVASLAQVTKNPAGRDQRARALYGSWLCGVCLNSAGMALHHKLCHELGGSFRLPHAETHTIVLPHAIAYNAPAVPEAYARMQRAVADASPQRCLFDLANVEGVPRSLRELGMPRDGIAQTIECVLNEPYWNPRPLEAEPLRDLLTRAWNGAPPLEP
jgi:alcohol dehydrogenase class IV